MAGGVGEKPEALKATMGDLEAKIASATTIAMINDFARVAPLINYTKEAEKILFNVEDMAMLPTEDLMARYDKAMKSMNGSLEYTRKVLTSNINKAPIDPEIDAIVTLLSSLSPDRIKRLKEMVLSGEM